MCVACAPGVFFDVVTLTSVLITTVKLGTSPLSFYNAVKVRVQLPTADVCAARLGPSRAGCVTLLCSYPAACPGLRSPRRAGDLAFSPCCPLNAALRPRQAIAAPSGTSPSGLAVVEKAKAAVSSIKVAQALDAIAAMLAASAGGKAPRLGGSNGAGSGSGGELEAKPTKSIDTLTNLSAYLTLYR
jgi:hypothetical protein